jgi:hypothetical protein
MSSKGPRGSASKAAGAINSLRLEVERLVQKERYKEAVKQAKLCYKEEATPENHRLLERAYFLRGRQLLQLGMRSSAVEVAQHLLDFGVTASDSLEDLVRLLMTLGFERQAFEIQERLGSPEMKDRLSELAADQAVAHPERSPGLVPETARDAGRVRQSLEKLQAGDEAGALELLRDLARSSPLSEWKFFVRGLAALQRHDPAETQANWNRLDRSRMAWRIAQRLQRLAPEQPGADPANLEILEKLAFGEPILARLRQLASLAASQEWDKGVRVVASLRQSLRRIDPKLAERLTRVLIGSLVKTTASLPWPTAERLVTDFTRVAEPVAIDPRWNRLWAILWDGPRGDSAGAIAYWNAYLEDLKTIPALGPGEQELAQAMIWNHIASLHLYEVDELSDPGGAFAPTFANLGPQLIDQKKVEATRKQVIDCLEKSLQIAPLYLPTYRMLVQVYAHWEDTKNFEAAARRLLAAFPEDVETLERLGSHYVERNEPATALPQVQRARQLKPLDHSLRELEWTIRISLARNYALAEHWDEGRAEFAAAEQLLPDCRHQYYYLARRVIFEAKAGQAELSDQYLGEAQQSLIEPTPLWLALAIEAIRYRMPPAIVDDYTARWVGDLKKKFRSETAGELASLLESFLSANIEYRGRDEHIGQVVAYLRRSVRSKYSREDIERVCEFLYKLPEESELFEKLVKLGLKQHAESALLNFRAGLVELKDLPSGRGGTKARQYLETARKLAEASADPKVNGLLSDIKGTLTLLNEVSERTRGLPSFFSRFALPIPRPGRGTAMPAPAPEAFFGEYDDDEFYDDEFNDDAFDDEDFEPGPSPPPRRRKKRASRKK